MRAIFNLFLGDEECGITARDIATYTTFAFRAMYKLQPSLEGEVGTNCLSRQREQVVCFRFEIPPVRSCPICLSVLHSKFPVGASASAELRQIPAYITQ